MYDGSKTAGGRIEGIYFFRWWEEAMATKPRIATDIFLRGWWLKRNWKPQVKFYTRAMFLWLQKSRFFDFFLIHLSTPHEHVHIDHPLATPLSSSLILSSVFLSHSLLCFPLSFPPLSSSLIPSSVFLSHSLLCLPLSFPPLSSSPIPSSLSYRVKISLSWI